MPHAECCILVHMFAILLNQAQDCGSQCTENAGRQPGAGSGKHEMLQKVSTANTRYLNDITDVDTHILNSGCQTNGLEAIDYGVSWLICATRTFEEQPY